METPLAANTVGNHGNSAPHSTGADNNSIRQSVLRGSAWTLVGFGSSQILRLGSNIILAAILYQEAFALMAVATAIIQGLAMFSDIGLAPSVVQNKRGDDRDFLNTAWTLQVIRGIGLATVAALLAWPMAWFYAQNDPKALELRWLLPIIAIGTLIGGFRSSKIMSAARHMNLGRVTAIELSSQIAGLAVMIALALLTHSVYALAIGNVVSSILHCALSHIMLAGPVDRFCWNKHAVREIVNLGKWIFLSTLIFFLAMQIDKLIFARLFPLEIVGVYSIAAGLAVITPTLMGRLQSMIAFPLYSRMLDRHSPLGPIFDRSKFSMLVAGGYLVSLSIAGAQTFVEFAYDDRYSAAGLYIPILAGGSWFSVIEGVYGSAFLATGHARWVALVNGIKVVTFCLLVFPASHFGGIAGAVIAVAVSDATRLVTTILCARNIGLQNQKSDYYLTLYTAGVGLGVWWITLRSPMLTNLHPVLLLTVQFTLVTLAFLPLFVVTARSMAIKNI